MMKSGYFGWVLIHFFLDRIVALMCCRLREEAMTERLTFFAVGGVKPRAPVLILSGESGNTCCAPAEDLTVEVLVRRLEFVPICLVDKVVPTLLRCFPAFLACIISSA